MWTGVLLCSDIVILFCMSVFSACMCEVQEGWKRARDPLKLELQTMVSCPVGSRKGSQVLCKNSKWKREKDADSWKASPGNNITPGGSKGHQQNHQEKCSRTGSRHVEMQAETERVRLTNSAAKEGGWAVAGSSSR